MKRIFASLLAVSLLSSCALINKVATKTTGGVIQAGSNEPLTEGNFEFFKQATPGNLKLVEGLWYSDQENKQLLSLLIKGYSAYAFAVAETEALTDILQDKQKTARIDYALELYNKSIFYGEKYLEVSGIEARKFWDKSFSLKINEKFDSTFSESDYVAILYFAQALGSSINLQRQNMVKMSFMNHAKNMASWVCKKDPGLEVGLCGLFQTVLMASMPSVMGGSQQKARKSFKKMMTKSPTNLLIRISYVQYHLIPMLEEEEFSREMRVLNRSIKDWYHLMKGNTTKTNQRYLQNRKHNLYNSIARKRYDKIIKLKNDIF